MSSPTGLPSKRGPGLGSFSRADRGIGGVRYREKQWDFCVWKGGHSAWRPDEQCWGPWGPSLSLSPCVRLQEGEAPGLRVWFPPSHELLGHVLQLCLLLGVRWQSARGPVRTCPSCPERGPSALDGRGQELYKAWRPAQLQFTAQSVPSGAAGASTEHLERCPRLNEARHQDRDSHLGTRLSLAS